ncbi:class I SAM-dependent methyltransferase [Chitinophaga sp. GCM10012297]|uniref:Class I SAM-dependent methyltransferase n=1 Tax=Chitinophaga chungangae TaxID=2821488 RepID=A0ABS3YDR4_9BACT|nr:class I SAM-dependent methyltransferase [Chitinophaga chungangae]MBO9152453.1 class I SAM-dependent methyltransferase [Chitinophaga chungangae]
MELLEKLKVAPTAAIVMLQARPLYTSGLAARYYTMLDLDGVQEVSAEIGKVFRHFTDIVLYRKKFIRYLLEQYLDNDLPVQVCILGAGLDPLSLWLMENRRDAVSGIFEVDDAHIPLKSALYNKILPEPSIIHFIQADITDTLHLLDKLRDAGYSPEKPAIIVFEGLIHYIRDEQFLNTMHAFRTPNKTNVAMLDYLLPEDYVPEHTLPMYAAFKQKIETFIGGSFQTYSRPRMFRLISLLHGDVAGVDSLQDVEFKLNGRNELFYEEGEGFMEMTSFYL